MAIALKLERLQERVAIAIIFIFLIIITLPNLKRSIAARSPSPFLGVKFLLTAKFMGAFTD